MGPPPDWILVADAAACFVLAPLTIWILLNGIDDLVVDAVAFVASVRSTFQLRPAIRTVRQMPERPIAVFVPCWHEHEVIPQMIQRNLGRIRYDNCTFFIGVYPNDEETVATVRRAAERYPQVHMAMCPHEGPTSKADCLNWIYQRMLLEESASGVRFEVIVTHDAEDVIHPDAMTWINWYADEYDMIQVPVLPLPTPVWHWVHGVYCDEFAEYQARDMPAREIMNAFVPSNGVGTGFRREALEGLALDEANRIFEPVCLTEDYENGLRLKLRGAKQLFVRSGNAITREYFPQSMRSAIRQKTRWVTGIALQTWDRHGWRGNLACRYWLWRDRKGLIGNPASLLSNLLFFYGAGTLAISECCGWEWGMRKAVQDLGPALGATALLGTYRIIYRGVCVGVHYGAAFVLTVPLRVLVANLINSAATFRAAWRFGISKWRGEPLRWLKTEHEYPTAAALTFERLRLGEILVRNGYLSRADLARALETQPRGLRIGEHLIKLNLVDEKAVDEALRLQGVVPELGQRAA
ncbi:MAG TPA: glycosyl transferase family protein [Bryobacteraceae bacterium]|nr:glycosyl transferase family protein [Bryobacteraceae bacterium]